MNTNRDFEPCVSNSNDRDEGHENEEGAITLSMNMNMNINMNMNCNNAKGEEKQGKSSINGDVSEKSEEAEEEEVDNDDPNKRWKEFVDAVEPQAKAIPNLEAYLKAKAIRTEKSIQFANAIDACIQALRDTTNEILSDVVAPVCNQYTERFEDTEDDITKTIVSNHSRRNKLLKLMDDADDSWSNKYTKLTADILGEVSCYKKINKK